MFLRPWYTPDPSLGNALTVLNLKTSHEFVSSKIFGSLAMVGGGTRWDLRSFPIQTSVGFHENAKMQKKSIKLPACA